MTAPDKDRCIRAVAAIVMALQEGGANADDIVDALEAASRCEARLREAAVSSTWDSGERK